MLPNFFVIGAAKAGTTALHDYLAAHPEIHMSAVKEPEFFAPEDRSRLAGVHSRRIGDRDAYERLFETPLGLRGESSPAYSQHPRRPGVPERIAEAVPEARFVYVVRDPIERIVAAYAQRASQLDQPPLAEAIGDVGDPANDFVCPSRYMTQVERYLAVFPAARVLVVDQDEMRRDRRASLRRVFEFLGADPGFWAPAFEREANPTAAKRGPSRAYRRLAGSRPGGWAKRALPVVVAERLRRAAGRALRPALDPVVVPPELERRLRELLVPEVEALRGFTGLGFERWSV